MEQLAAACEVSVDTVRYYQSLGLLPAPEREGRVAWYGPRTPSGSARSGRLQSKGLTLAAIRRVVGGRAGPRGRRPRRRGGGRPRGPPTATPGRSPRGLLAGVGRAVVADPGRGARGRPRWVARSTARCATRRATSRSCGSRSGCSSSGCRWAICSRSPARPTRRCAGWPSARWSSSTNTSASRSATRRWATRRAADQMVTAFRELLPAVTTLVSHHFRRVLLEVAEAHIGRVGGDAEVEATRAEARRHGAGARDARARHRCPRARRRPGRCERCSTRSRPLRPGEPRHDVRDGRRVAPAHGARAPAAGRRTGPRPRLRDRRPLPRAAARSGYRAVGFDFSHGMLAAAQTDAPLVRPTSCACRSVTAAADGVTCGFALRNVVSLEAFFRELGRVVRVGGRIALLDASEPDNRVMRSGHGVYFRRVVPTDRRRAVGRATRTRTCRVRWRTCRRRPRCSRCCATRDSPTPGGWR